MRLKTIRNYLLAPRVDEVAFLLQAYKGHVTQRTILAITVRSAGKLSDSSHYDLNVNIVTGH